MTMMKTIALKHRFALSSSLLVLLIVGALTIAWIVRPAHAGVTLGDKMYCGFAKHATSCDKNTTVEWVIVFQVEVASIGSGNNVGWQINSVAFSELDSYGHVVKKWKEYAPDLDTPDGLWWVNHASATPVHAEFTILPFLSGTAAYVVGSTTNLDYEIQTAALSGGMCSSGNGLFVDLDHNMAILIPPEADEPVECPPIDDANGTA